MKIKLFSYNQLDTLIHRLSGTSKLACFLLLTTAVMMTYDIRVITLIFVFSVVLTIMAKLPWQKIKPMVVYVLIFLVMNFVLTYLFAPTYGCEIYGTKHVLFHIAGKYDVTKEQLLYQCTKTMKYLSTIPLGFIFILTTDPSEFASSLNHIKVPYKVCTVLSLTLRYFPDIQNDYNDISCAQQARGLDNSKKAKLSQRIKNTTKLIIPLVFSSMDRIDLVTNAMELRGYGKNKKRTWYSFRPLQTRDFVAMGICALVLVFTLVMRFGVVKSMYWNPFV